MIKLQKKLKKYKKQRDKFAKKKKLINKKFILLKKRIMTIMRDFLKKTQAFTNNVFKIRNACKTFIDKIVELLDKKLNKKQ